MVVGRLAITRTVAGRQETSPRSHSMQGRCISQALQNRSSMMKKETGSLLAVNTCYPWSIQNHNRNYSSNLTSGRTSTPLTKRLPWSWTLVQMSMPLIGPHSRNCFQMWNYSRAPSCWRTLIRLWWNRWELSSVSCGGRAKSTGSRQKWWTLKTLPTSYQGKQLSSWAFWNLAS